MLMIAGALVFASCGSAEDQKAIEEEINAQADALLNEIDDAATEVEQPVDTMAVDSMAVDTMAVDSMAAPMEADSAATEG